MGEKRTPVKKHVGNWSSKSYDPQDKKLVTFWSKAKEQTVYVSDNEFIIFKNRQYRTNGTQQINFLRGHPQFNITIAENDIPKEWIREFKRNEALLTKDPEEYEA